MLINEVCRECGLTKKAVTYYEKQNLLCPGIGENGYRIYSERDAAILKEITLLRKLGVGLADIKTVLISENKASALLRCKRLAELRIKRAAFQKECMERLIDNYDIEKETAFWQAEGDDFLTVKEKMIQAFPGAYGVYLSIHFGRFLNEKIDSTEKAEAYSRVMLYLDRVELPAELETCLEEAFSALTEEDMEKMDASMTEAIENFDAYMENMQESVREYIKVRTSDAFMKSSAGRLQQLMASFQRESGYSEEFIANMKILSRSYTEYLERAGKTNEALVKKYPELREETGWDTN